MEPSVFFSYLGLIAIIIIVTSAATAHFIDRKKGQRGEERRGIKLSRAEAKAADTQENAHGRIRKQLLQLNKDKGEQRGVEVFDLGMKENGSYIVNVFWTNEHHSQGILSIEIGICFLSVQSLPATCPQGRDIHWALSSIAESHVTRAIIEAQKFIVETYQMAYAGARAGAR